MNPAGIPQPGTGVYRGPQGLQGEVFRGIGGRGLERDGMGWVYREGLDEGSVRGHFAESLAVQLCGLALLIREGLRM